MGSLQKAAGAIVWAGVAWQGQVASADVFATIAPGTSVPALYHATDNGQVRPGNSSPKAESYEAVTVGPDGNAYVAGNTLGRGFVNVFDGTTGAFIRSIVEPAMPNLARYTGPFGLSFGPDGDLYVTSNRFDVFPRSVSGLVRLDPTTGAVKSIPINLGLGVTEFSVRDVAFGPSGRPFITSSAGIVTTSELDEEPDFGSGRLFIPVGTGGLSGPTSLQFDAAGVLYVLNVTGPTSSNVLRYDGTTGAFINTFLSTSAGDLGRLADIAFAANGDLLATNATSGSIYRFDGTSGAYAGVLTDFGNVSLGGLAAGAVPEPTIAFLAGAMLIGLRRTRIGR